MTRQRNDVLLIGLDAGEAARLTSVGKALGVDVGALSSPSDAEILLDSRSFQLIVAAGEDARQLLPDARAWKERMPLVEIIGVVEQVPDVVPAPLFDVLCYPLPGDDVIRAVLQRALRYQNAVERNNVLFRRLQATVRRLEAAQQQAAVLAAENRLLQRAVEDHAQDAAASAAETDIREDDVLTSARLQRFFESLAEAFNKALDSMLFYSSQVLLQSDGSEAALALSQWIEREVSELRTVYEGLIQEYYTELVVED
ncbi:MAG: hypothetical protein D6761_04520 [Candidatus Dadabacteria bacterium]|nr:MAG: hypothetical protein D6761_04520 [Candidatus Dadabacteria bacterium]